ncbi:MAG: 2-C-methyl-D-erythritol 4-phosphate cytidylyltransferase [Desulfobacter sp.]|nr:MAG: 2-C-methyl-D-erythritol 4-phosphate cytidylyltransferase [Desulfobacter sp.]
MDKHPTKKGAFDNAASSSEYLNIAVIVAGGKGLRMQSDIKKQYLTLAGLPVLSRTIRAFDGHPRIDGIILVVPPADFKYCRDNIVAQANPATPLHLAAGGQTRQESVSSGLAKAADISQRNPKTVFVLVHDGVRPFVKPALVDACLDRASETGACIPALEMTDTIKQVDAGRRIVKTLDRTKLFRAQTPQVFRLDLLAAAYDHAAKTEFTGTDEASVLEHTGMPVDTVAGDSFNIKLTTPADLMTAEFLLTSLQARQPR